MSRFTVTQVVDTLHQITQEYPDRVDPRSQTQNPRYISDGRAQCLVAEVLVRLGVSVRSIRQLDREFRGRPVEIGGSRHPVVRRMPGPARELLDFVQRVQDSGHTWGYTVRWATDPTGMRTVRWMCEYGRDEGEEQRIMGIYYSQEKVADLARELGQDPRAREARILQMDGQTVAF